MTKSIYSACLLLYSLALVSGNADALCVTVSEANLRSGPGTNYDKTWEVYKYMPLRKVGQKGDWYKVKDVDGDSHWIYKKLVSASVHCAVVRKSTANVRTGPGTNYPKVNWSPVEHYYSFRRIGSKGDWIKVKDEAGDTGWVAKSLLWLQ